MMGDPTRQRMPPQNLYRSGHLWRKWRNEHPKNTEGIPQIRRRTEDLQNDIPDLPTVLMTSVPVSPRDMGTGRLIARILGSNSLYKDAQGRVCLRMVDVGIRTIDLVDAGVQQFYQMTGEYPTEIVPCPSRLYGLRNTQFYYPPRGGDPIPYVADFSLPVGYDVIFRRKS